MKRSFAAAIVIWQVALPFSAHSTELIKQRNFTYSYDDEAQGMEDDTFIICSDCQDGKLNKIYTMAVHYSAAPEAVTMPHPENTVSNVLDTKEKVTATKWKEMGIVHFPFNSAILSSKEQKYIEGLGLMNKSMKLEGFTCILGTDQYNVRLSERRAKSVADYLRRKGISVLGIAGNGKSSKYQTKSDNRRVEIYAGEKE